MLNHFCTTQMSCNSAIALYKYLHHICMVNFYIALLNLYFLLGGRSDEELLNVLGMLGPVNLLPVKCLWYYMNGACISINVEFICLFSYTAK